MASNSVACSKNQAYKGRYLRLVLIGRLEFALKTSAYYLRFKRVFSANLTSTNVNCGVIAFCRICTAHELIFVFCPLNVCAPYETNPKTMTYVSNPELV